MTYNEDNFHFDSVYVKCLKCPKSEDTKKENFIVNPLSARFHGIFDYDFKKIWKPFFVNCEATEGNVIPNMKHVGFITTTIKDKKEVEDKKADIGFEGFWNDEEIDFDGEQKKVII